MSTFSFNIFSDTIQGRVHRRKLSKNETVFLEGAEVESIYFVEQGCVRLVVFPQEGKQMVLYRARTGEPFAEEHLTLARYSYRAVADEGSIIQSISKQLLLDDVYTNPEVARRYIGCISSRYYQLRTNFERLGISSAKARVLHLLNTMNCEGIPAIDLDGKIKSLSDDLNLTHEATYRALRELEEGGAIKRNNGIVEICQISPSV